MNIVNEKKCSKCGIVKSFSEFGKDSRASSGLRSSCRKCDSLQKKEYYANKKASTTNNKNDNVAYTSNFNTVSSNNLRTFTNSAFGNVRTVVIQNEPWFIATDVCNALNIANITQAVSTLDIDEKRSLCLTQGAISRDNLINHNINIVNEYGLYSLVLSSRKPEAKEFKRWITHEVIPDVRKTGMYMTNNVIEQIINDPDKLFEVFNNYRNEKAKRIEAENIIALNAPKVEFYDNVLKSDKTKIAITEIAKDYGLTAIKMNKFLCDCKVQFRVRDHYVLNANYSNKGYAFLQNYIDEYNRDHLTLYWTEKGREFLYNYLKKFDMFPKTDIA